MKAKDMLKLSVNSIIHRKLRSWLTLLGIIIGVAAVVAIISIGEGAQASVNERLSGFGADVLTLSAGFNRAEGFGGFFRGGERPGTSRNSGSSTSKTPELTIKDSLTLKSNPEISSVNEIVSGRADLVYLAGKSSVQVQGVNAISWPDFLSLQLASGRLLNSSDTSGIVIGDRVANSMFKQPITLGKKVTVGERQFTVIGILEASGTQGFGGSDSGVFMTQENAWLVTDVNKGIFSSIQAKVRNIDSIDATVAELTQSLMLSRRVNESSIDFSITSAQAIKQQVSSVTDTLTLFLGAIAAISLVVGAIGVANSMFTSVLEKTKLIGILKALGSTSSEIMLMFVMEAGLFGLVGGIIGAGLGTLASFMLSGIGIIPIPSIGRGGAATLVTPQLFIIAVLLSTAVGIASGFFPARTASKMNPIEALRYE